MSKISIDAADCVLLESLVENSRLPLKELAARASLSSPTTADRLRKLEEREVIRAFTAELDAAALGYPMMAIVRIRPLPGRARDVEALIRAIEEISECDKVTGEDCFIARIHLKSMAHLDEILERVAVLAETNSAMVKSSPINRRPPPLKENLLR